MKFQVVAVVVAFLCFEANFSLAKTVKGKPYDPSIVGGVSADHGEYPHQVSVQLRHSNFHFCGGSILSPYWILTASHCLEVMSPGIMQIVAGDHHLKEASGREQKINVRDFIMHEQYNITGHTEHDIALLLLSEPLELNEHVATIPLAQEFVEPGTLCTVTGWGAQQFAPEPEDDPMYPVILREVTVPVVSDEVCEAGCRRNFCKIREEVVCAGLAMGGKDSCQGDSGGPLVCNDASGKLFQLGIVSTGYGCAFPNMYGQYTDVYYYKDWVKQKMALLSPY